MFTGPLRKAPGVAIAAAALSMGCAAEFASRPPALEPQTAPARSALDGSPVCKSLGDRFIGLPTVSAAHARSTLAPLAGSWWVRSCSATKAGDQLQIRLQGPGWYWVEESGSGISVRQQVPFQLGLELDGRLRDSFASGVFSLWFEPATAPRVRVVAPARLDVHSRNAIGWMLQLVPLVSPGKMAAERFSESMTTALQERLQAGATVTFDVGSGQSDAAVGRLEAGKTPQHPFTDPGSWVVNDRVLLAPSATQVMGPINPGLSRLDVVVESGTGLSYKAVCSERMGESYSAIASGELSRVPASAWVASGRVDGIGPHTAVLGVESCKFYLVIASTGPSGTLAALRVRG